MDSLASTNESWHLRHVGAPSTIDKSSTVIRLMIDGQVTVGRGPKADYFLDSVIYVRLISRIHAVISGEKLLNGHIRFTLTNKGLNGTYINDFKLGVNDQNSQILREGDKVAFGHINCGSIRVGEYAPQPHSEFQFLFERVKTSTEQHSDQDDVVSTNPLFSPYPSDTPAYSNGENFANEYDNDYHPSSPKSADVMSEKENKMLKQGCSVHSFDHEDSLVEEKTLQSVLTGKKDLVNDNDKWPNKVKQSDVPYSVPQRKEILEPHSGVCNRSLNKTPLPDVVPDNDGDVDSVENDCPGNSSKKNFKHDSLPAPYRPVSSSVDERKEFSKSVIDNIKHETDDENSCCGCCLDAKDCVHKILKDGLETCTNAIELLKGVGEGCSACIKVENVNTLVPQKSSGFFAETFDGGLNVSTLPGEVKGECNILLEMDTNGKEGNGKKMSPNKEYKVESKQKFDMGLSRQMSHEKEKIKLKSKREWDDKTNFEKLPSAVIRLEKLPEDVNGMKFRNGDVTFGNKRKMKPNMEETILLSSEDECHLLKYFQSSSPVVVMEKMPDNVEGNLWKSKENFSKLKVQSKNIKKHHHHHHHHVDHNVQVKQSTSRSLLAIHSSSKTLKSPHSHQKIIHVKHKKKKSHHTPPHNQASRTDHEESCAAIPGLRNKPDDHDTALNSSEPEEFVPHENETPLSPTSTCQTVLIDSLPDTETSKSISTTQMDDLSLPSSKSLSSKQTISSLSPSPSPSMSSPSQLSTSSGVSSLSKTASLDLMYPLAFKTRNHSTGFLTKDFNSEDEEEASPNTTPLIVKKIYSPSRNQKKKTDEKILNVKSKSRHKSRACDAERTNESDASESFHRKSNEEDVPSDSQSRESNLEKISSATENFSNGADKKLSRALHAGTKDQSSTPKDKKETIKPSSASVTNVLSSPVKSSFTNNSCSKDITSPKSATKSVTGKLSSSTKSSSGKNKTQNSLLDATTLHVDSISAQTLPKKAETSSLSKPTKDNSSSLFRTKKSSPEKFGDRSSSKAKISASSEKNESDKSERTVLTTSIASPKKLPSKEKIQNEGGSTLAIEGSNDKPIRIKLSVKRKLCKEAEPSPPKKSTHLSEDKLSSLSKSSISHKKLSFKQFYPSSSLSPLSSDSSSSSSSSSSSLSSFAKSSFGSGASKKKDSPVKKTNSVKETSSMSPSKSSTPSAERKTTEVKNKQPVPSSGHAKEFKTKTTRSPSQKPDTSQAAAAASTEKNEKSRKEKHQERVSRCRERSCKEPDNEKSKDEKRSSSKANDPDTKVLKKDNLIQPSTFLVDADKKVERRRPKRNLQKAECLPKSPVDVKISKRHSSSPPKSGKKPVGNLKRKRRCANWSRIADISSSEDEGQKFEQQQEIDESEDTWSLEDGIQYCDAPCGAAKCSNPVGRKVDWVMCDQCERWYHMVCVNTSIEQVEKDGDQFMCGFC